MSSIFYSENSIVNIAENLVKTYIYTHSVKSNTEDRLKILDEFIIGLTGLFMLMTEDDKEHIIKLINKNDLRQEMLDSIGRIKENKSLAFT